MNSLTHPQARALADAFTENNPVPWKRQVPITDIQKLTAAIKDGAHIPLDDLILFLYAAQGIVADHPAMLWLEKETPESLADALMKAQWLSGEGPRPLSMSGPWCWMVRGEGYECINSNHLGRSQAHGERVP